MTCQALERNLQWGRNKEGAQVITGGGFFSKNLKTAGMSWETEQYIAGDQTKWKIMVEALS